MKGLLIHSEEISFGQVKPGVTRRILGYIDQLMAVEMHFQKGAIGDLHSHPHAQTGYVLQGSFEIQAGDRKSILKQGDCYLIEPHVMHGAVCLEDNSRVLDIFTPKREDFLK